jgi:glycosyltransferase involved in cell wall biosynthesis
MSECRRRRGERSGGLFVGPLTPTGGARTLFSALDLFAGTRVEVLGPDAPRHRVRERMARAAYLVLPGTAYDTVPRPLIEAFASALPVIASCAGVLADLIEPGRNGLLFEPGAARELARRLAWAEAFPEKMRQMGECAQADYHARFGADWTYQRLFGERRRYARAL